MVGKSFLLGLLLVSELAAQSFRYTQVCEIENAPTPEMEKEYKKGCVGTVFHQGEQVLLQSATHSMLTQKSKTGGIETIILDHEKKEMRVLSLEKVSDEMRKNPLGPAKIPFKVEVRNLNPDRVIEGHVAKGFDLSIGLDSEKLKDSPFAGMLVQFQISQEVWVARDLKLPWTPESQAQRGVGASANFTRKIIQEMLSVFDLGGEAFARLEEIPPGLVLEATIRTHADLSGKGKAMIVRTMTKDIKTEKIPVQVFAVPEGYKRLE